MGWQLNSGRAERPRPRATVRVRTQPRPHRPARRAGRLRAGGSAAALSALPILDFAGAMRALATLGGRQLRPALVLRDQLGGNFDPVQDYLSRSSSGLVGGSISARMQPLAPLALIFKSVRIERHHPCASSPRDGLPAPPRVTPYVSEVSRPASRRASRAHFFTAQQSSRCGSHLYRSGGRAAGSPVTPLAPPSMSQPPRPFQGRSG